MEDRPDMRASDADRQEVVERLRGALDEGRLKMDEYLERMGLAYEAVTYGDLVPLCRDLPEARPAAKQAAAAAPAPAPQGQGQVAAPQGQGQVAAPQGQGQVAAPQGQGQVAARGAFASLPTPLKVLWTVWLTVVSINVVVWVLVSGTTAHLIYPWPLWVAGPWGAVLLGLSLGARQIRRGRGA